MKEIILEKRYPHSREEDITDAFMRGYETGKEQEHRWWSTFCANCKTDNSSEIPNNCEDFDPYTDSFIDNSTEELNAYRKCVESRSFWDNKHCDGCYFDERCPFDEPKGEPQTERSE